MGGKVFWCARGELKTGEMSPGHPLQDLKKGEKSSAGRCKSREVRPDTFPPRCKSCDASKSSREVFSTLPASAKVSKNRVATPAQGPKVQENLLRLLQRPQRSQKTALQLSRRPQKSKKVALQDLQRGLKVQKSRVAGVLRRLFSHSPHSQALDLEVFVWSAVVKRSGDTALGGAERGALRTIFFPELRTIQSGAALRFPPQSKATTVAEFCLSPAVQLVSRRIK